MDGRKVRGEQIEMNRLYVRREHLHRQRERRRIIGCRCGRAASGDLPWSWRSRFGRCRAVQSIE